VRLCARFGGGDERALGDRARRDRVRRLHERIVEEVPARLVAVRGAAGQ